MNEIDNKQLKEQLDRIERALIGDPNLGQAGVIPRLKRVEDKQESIDKKLMWASGFIGALVIAWEFIKQRFIS